MFREVLYQQLEQSGFQDWVETLRTSDKHWFSAAHHGDFERWNQALKSLPPIDDIQIQLNRSAVTVSGSCEQGELLLQALQGLKPWRKGPFQLADVFIDTEWHSDYKWDRIHRHLSPLKQRRILDVGCGNGYHCWRMLAYEPELVLGIDPSILFNLQFRALQYYIQDKRIHMLPVGIQHMPVNMQWFDTVFSMGVLYHRKSPIDHLLQLKSLLRPGGELCLETLVIEGDSGQVLVPGSRYARMNNVWFLPSTDELSHWLDRCGFSSIRVVDVNQTSIQEQRSTEWMPFESLPECLDPNDPNKTVEGYPAPLRAVIIATK
jgi:tRNA (mo5U34)-methyltransferase